MSFLNRLLLLCCLLYGAPLAAQSRQDAFSAADKLLRAQSFAFYAQNATPFNGDLQQLNPGHYYVTVSKDSVVCYLPYFGRLWTLPRDVTHMGIDFISTGFRYHLYHHKKDKEVHIVFNDQRDIRELRFTVGEDGYATLRVRSNSRDQMSYYGTIEPLEGRRSVRK